MAPKVIRWLHISDLHMGCRGEEIWWQVRSEFRDSILKQFRPLDMILVTGDLTFSAQREQFDLFNRFLDDLLGWLREAGQESDPLVIPVPGNHDLVWPVKSQLRNYRVLEKLNKPGDEDVSYFCEELWQDRNASLFDPLFGNYMSWLEKKILPHLTGRPDIAVRRSHFPGDLSVCVDVRGGPPLTVVGLNSAWVQYTQGDFERRTELFTQQLHYALGAGGSGSPLDALEGRQNLLLMHHPPSWLSREAQRRFNEEIYLPDRFLLCLCGHMHEGRSDAVSRSGGRFRYFFQAPSLFGLEGYGRSDESRAMGYTWGEMDVHGTVKVRPFKRGSQGGQQVFLWDMEFEPDPTGHRIRPLFDVLPDTARAADIVPWLEHLLDRTSYIEISGIGSGVGRTWDASRYPIEQLYTPLRSRDETRDFKGRSRVVSLAELMSRHSLLLIEGQPGAGKTTFLRLVATMLARDLLRIPCPDAASWREKHLGMTGRTKPPAPLFLKLSELAALLAQAGSAAFPDDHRRLFDLLGLTAGAIDGEDWRRYWQVLLQRGEAVLLLDGLDDVADDRLRERIFTILRDSLRQWKKAGVMMTSRPFGAEAACQMGFHHAAIEDFGKEEIREFIERWVAALYNLPIGQRPEGAAGEKSDRIIRDVLRRPAIRQLAANPVMLTCLCVVHWNEGDLPEGRARLYRTVIQWVIAERTPQREQAGFTDRFALEAFAALAFAMMGESKGAKTTLADFEVGAEAVLALVERHFPREIVLRRARDWLRFECLWSGIVEEPMAGKVRFWHLTFQEYLAAQELAWRRDGDGTEDWWPVVKGRLDDLQWRETVDLLPGLLFIEGGGRRVDLLLRRVIELRGEQPSLAVNARFFGIVGRILGPMIAYSYKPPSEIEGLYQELRDHILPMFGHDGAAKVPVKTRIEAAEALGQGGDLRLEGDTLIEVPDTGGLSLGKYPVTVTEYQEFVDAGGYHDSNYWDEAGWRLRREQQWEEPDGWDRQLEHPNWPVTGVSWYEARAYCQWRSSDSVWTIRLPKAAEWQAAATPDGREYPWGVEKPNPEHANFGRNVGSPTPVGIYPPGDGRYGHCDLAGNVWEWMENIQYGIDSTPNYLQHGGSWNDNSRYLLCAVGRWNTPDLRTSDQGFRVALF